MSRKNKRYYSKSETAAFYDGLDRRVRLDKNLSSKERKAWEKGARIHDTDDYKVAYRYTNHMNNKYGSGRKDKYGRELDYEGKPLPTAYKNYKSMQKDPELKKGLYEDYGW